ncbi:MAG: DUF4336 domain-containing protein [Paracoccaceae bacterium]
MNVLIPFGPDIWIADGRVLNIAGFAYPTRMAVMRLQGGGLVIWSPVALTAELRAAVAALGPVQHIIGPNLSPPVHCKMGGGLSRGKGACRTGAAQTPPGFAL